MLFYFTEGVTSWVTIGMWEARHGQVKR
jgi:hypothetical protein